MGSWVGECDNVTEALPLFLAMVNTQIALTLLPTVAMIKKVVKCFTVPIFSKN